MKLLMFNVNSKIIKDIRWLTGILLQTAEAGAPGLNLVSNTVKNPENM